MVRHYATGVAIVSAAMALALSLTHVAQQSPYPGLCQAHYEGASNFESALQMQQKMMLAGSL